MFILVRVVEVDAVEAADCEGEDELEEAEDEADKRADGAAGGGALGEALNNAHLEWCLCFLV